MFISQIDQTPLRCVFKHTIIQLKKTLKSNGNGGTVMDLSQMRNYSIKHRATKKVTRNWYENYH